jgi:hypothetical protein
MPKETSVTVTLATSDGEMIERFAVFDQRHGAVELAALVHDTVASHHAVGPVVDPNVETLRHVAEQLEAAHDRLTLALERLTANAESLR